MPEIKSHIAMTCHINYTRTATHTVIPTDEGPLEVHGHPDEHTLALIVSAYETGLTRGAKWLRPSEYDERVEVLRAEVHKRCFDQPEDDGIQHWIKEPFALHRNPDNEHVAILHNGRVVFRAAPKHVFKFERGDWEHELLEAA